MTQRPRPRRIRDARQDETRVHEGLPQPDDATAQGPAAPPSAQGRMKLQRVEERIVPRVSRQRAGKVLVRKRVVEEPEEVTVQLRHDELDLERRRADRPLAPGEQPVTERGDTTILLVVEERLEVRRVPWVVEEIHLRRRLVTEEQQVRDTVRKERFEIATEGELELKSD